MTVLSLYLLSGTTVLYIWNSPCPCATAPAAPAALFEILEKKNELSY